MLSLSQTIEAGGAFLWERPLGLLALLLPLLLFLLSRRKRRPPVLATGTLALWKEIGTASRNAARRRAGTPLATWLAIAALASATLALAGPRFLGELSPRYWTVVVDRSPSTSLALGGETRLEDSLARLAARLGERLGPLDRVRWVSPGLALEETGGASPPPGWLAPGGAPGGFASEPRWDLYDDEGTYWVTDHAPETAPRKAGVIASGGPAVPGAISSHGRDLLLWDGSEVSRVVDALAPRALVLRTGEGVEAEPLRAFLGVFARERGLVLLAEPRDEPPAQTPALTVEVGLDSGALVPLVAGRGRWRWSGRVLAAGVEAREGDAVLWSALDAGVELPLLASAPGRLSLAWHGIGEPEGDPVAFALDWSRWLEDALLPAPGVVPLAERGAAGEGFESDPTSPGSFADPEAAASSSSPGRWDSRLALLAALLALAAVAARQIVLDTRETGR